MATPLQSNTGKEDYDTRAPEYDEWYRGEGVFARRERPGWNDAVAGLTAHHAAVEVQERVLGDGRRFEVFKRYFDAEGLLTEFGGGEIVFDSPWFVAVAVPAQAAAAASPSGSR